MPTDQSFEVTYQLSLIQVEPVAENRYRVQFSNEVPVLLFENNIDDNGNRHWIDLSSGNDALAAGIGHLIEAHQIASK